MERDFEEFIIARCEKALREDAEYMEMERSGNVSQEVLQVKAEVLCYKQCIKDTRIWNNL